MTRWIWFAVYLVTASLLFLAINARANEVPTCPCVSWRCPTEGPCVCRAWVKCTWESP